MIGFMFLTIFAVGGGALAIVQGQNPLGYLLIFIGVVSAGFMGNCYGRKSGLTMDFHEMPEDEQYVFYGKIQVRADTGADSTEVAIICKASDKPYKRKMIAVGGFFNNQISAGDIFTKKGDNIFIRK